MRSHSSRHILRRRQRARRAESLFALPRQALRRAYSRVAGRPWLLVSIPMLIILLAGASAWLGMRSPLVYAAPGALTAHPSVGRASPPDKTPNIAHWTDPQQQTAFSLQLRESGHTLPGRFVFLLPNGNQVRGYAPLQLQPDGSYIQQASTSGQPCALGALALTRLNASQISGLTPPVPFIAAGPIAVGPGYTTPVVYALTTRIDQYGLVAFAGLSYVASDDKIGVARVCSPAAFDYEMAAGCTVDVCTDPLATAGPTVGNHNGAVLHAVRANTADAWQGVYKFSARSVTGQYTDSEFASIMLAQTASQGKITQISPITSAPAIQYDAAGQAYFSVSQTVTLDHDGTTTTQQITSYYLLEGGAWLFWFSA